MGKFIDITGKSFNRLTALYPVRNETRHIMWMCKCVCGREVITRSSSLTSGNTQSCGCLKKDASSAAHTRHGHSCGSKVTATYSSWYAMLSRCSNPNDISYKYYGAKGITVCDRWNPKAGGSFDNFLIDMKERPTGCTIGRIKGNDNYYPENCEWQTSEQQIKERESRRK